MKLAATVFFIFMAATLGCIAFGSEDEEGEGDASQAEEQCLKAAEEVYDDAMKVASELKPEKTGSKISREDRMMRKKALRTKRRLIREKKRAIRRLHRKMKVERKKGLQDLEDQYEASMKKCKKTFSVERNEERQSCKEEAKAELELGEELVDRHYENQKDEKAKLKEELEELDTDPLAAFKRAARKAREHFERAKHECLLSNFMVKI